MGKLFSEIGSDHPALIEFEREYLSGKGIDAALIAAQKVRPNSGVGDTAIVSLDEIHRYITANLIAQIHGLWMMVQTLSRDSERHKGLYEEKMEDVARLRAQATMKDIFGNNRFDGPLGGGSGDGDGG